MRRLLLLRHAKTEGHEIGKDDLARVLIERGRDDAARMGAYIASHSLVPAHVILSPAARCQETWSQMASAMKPAPGIQTSDQIYDATPDDIFAAVTGAPADAQSLLIVGHNPGIHEAAVRLIASGNIDARELVREGMPTSALVIIDFAFDDWRKVHPQSGRLERFVTPKALDPVSR